MTRIVASPRRACAVVLLPCAMFLAGCGGSPGSSATPAPPPAAAATSAPITAPASVYSDVTEASGIAFVHRNGATGRRYLPETMGSGGCVLDYDGDGRFDVYLVQSGPVPGAASPDPSLGSRLFRNEDGMRFTDVTLRARASAPGYGMGAVAADYDNDGDTDIYQVNFGPNVLLRNEGDGTFTDVTTEAGVGDPLWGSSAAFFDADADGDLDLAVVNYLDFTVARHVECGDTTGGNSAYCHPDAYPMAPDRFFRNRGNGTFEDATREAGLTDKSGKGLGVVAFDFDGDGDTDLYVANDSTPNFLYRNDGHGRFEDVGLALGVAVNEDGKTEAGMGVDVGDVDGDDVADILVTNIDSEANALYLGGSDGFRYASRSSGIYKASFLFVGFGTDFLDWDNDGDLDLWVANGHVVDNIALTNEATSWKQPGHLFAGDGHGVFRLLAADEAGAAATPVAARGSITWDPDDDGRVDLLVQGSNDRARLYRNVQDNKNTWIGFSLRGRAGNRDGVGARITVDSGGRRLTEERKAGGSYQCSNDPRLHFGLGHASAAGRVIIRWPGGAVQELNDLTAGRYYRIEEGEPPEPLGAPPALTRPAGH